MKEEIKMLRKNVKNKLISTGNFPESSSKLPLFPLTTLEDLDELEELLEDAEQRRILVSIINWKAKLYIQNAVFHTLKNGF